MPHTLPALDPAAKALSDQLSQQIKQEIREQGGMSFARFMELALYAPSFGYYRNTYYKFGEQGDFVTAPEISALFSRCLANQCAGILSQLSHGDILEFGAGSGVMAADILIALKEKKQLPAQYYIIEISAALQTLQRETILKKIPDELHRVVWLTQLPEKPIHGVVLANEVLDAMPVTLFTMDNEIKEKVVTLDSHDQFIFQLSEKKTPVLCETLSHYKMPFEKGYTSEINLFLSGWIKSISHILERGLVLIIDYGFPRQEYYHPDRISGTLMCHYRHYAHANPLMLIGMQDITAHVDFTSVAESAHDHGLDVIGFTHQAAFLMNCGLLSFINEHAPAAQRFAINQQIMRLTLPSEMGELFKVIGLTKKMDCDVMGFKTMNQLSRL